MQPRKRVLVLIEHRYGYFRDVLRGVRAYARQGHPWILHTADIAAPAIERLFDPRPDGVVGHTGGPGRHRLIRDAHLPTVHAVRPMHEDGAPVVATDDGAVGRLAADHLSGTGLRVFGFAGEPGFPHALLRLDGYRQRLRVLHGGAAALHVFQHPVPPSREFGSPADEAAFLAWLDRLPRPIGLFAVNDTWAAAAADRCHECGLRIPDDVALLGVDNDDVLCESSNPPLSSIQTAGQRIGYEAARLLDARMAGWAGRRRRDHPPLVLVPPVQVVARESTHALPAASPPVVAALRFIHAQSYQPLAVADVAAAAHVSRRLLEMRFRAELGRTVLDAIHRSQVERVRHLLVETDLPMSAVAEAAGFSGATRMSIVFARHAGVTPSLYRGRTRIGPAAS